jgi:D-serine deaminase-like pyridoxal phosphate-dependent protein
MNLQSGQRDAAIGRSLNEIDTPALLIDADGLDHNIKTMASVLAKAPGHIRPHCKTHKSRTIARRQVDAGARGVCCAKLNEASVIAAGGGVDDVMVTTPVAGRQKFEQLAALARLAKTTVVLDDASTVPDLAAAAEKAQRTIDVVIEVDVGQGRCGVPPGPAAAKLVDEVRRFPKLRFKGLHGYQGKLQMVVAYAERQKSVQRALDLLLDTANHIRRAGYSIETLTGGGSGSLAIDIALGGLNEYQPGSYVFMDASYRRIEWDDHGGPAPFRCALSVLGTVVSRPSTDRAVIDVGWKSISCDSGNPVPLDDDLLFEFGGDEHGIVRRRNGAALDLTLGAKLTLLPSHCDTTVNLYDDYHLVRGGEVEAVLPVDARGRSR